MAFLDGDECVDCLAGELIVYADDGGFGDSVVLDQRCFDFGSGETVAGNVDDVVDAASDPVIAFVITASAITRELGTR